MISYLSPAYIDKTIIDRLKIKTCSKCDLLRDVRQKWKPWKRNKPRNQQSSLYKCDPEKCAGLVRSDYLIINGAIIIDNNATEILEERKCKYVPISLFQPAETPRTRSLFYAQRNDDNQKLIAEMSDVIQPNENNHVKEKNDNRSKQQKLIDDIEAVFKKHMFKMHHKTKALMLYNIICENDKGLFNGKIRELLIKNILEGNFTDIFKPWRILQALDSTSGGTVNYSGIESLRDALRDDNPLPEGDTIIDRKGKRRKKRRKFLLPSEFTIRQCAYALEKYANENFLNYEIYFDKHEILRFKYIDILKFLLKIYKLDLLAERTNNVEIAITLDGSKLTKQLFHVTAGLKIVDVHAWHPKLDTLLLPTDVETSGHSSIQSRDNSYVVEMHLMKDTKEGYKCFTNFFIMVLAKMVYLLVIKDVQ